MATDEFVSFRPSIKSNPDDLRLFVISPFFQIITTPIKKGHSSVVMKSFVYRRARIAPP